MTKGFALAGLASMIITFSYLQWLFTSDGSSLSASHFVD